MKPTVLFRASRNEEEELEICKESFPVSRSRVGIKDSLVIGRYSVLPFYRELEEDLKIQGSKLINSYHEHDFIASFDWYYEISHLTPRTYFDLREVPKGENNGPYVVKGRTNSRKHQWNTHMFAKDYMAIMPIYSELMNDPLIQNQGIIVRDYVPLENFGIGINGQPFANEWRCFFYKGKLLTRGYYWVNGDVIPPDSAFEQGAMDVAQEAADILKERTNFYVIDVAKTQSGKWIVIEVNDGQLSGLSGNDPKVLYTELKKALTKNNQ